MVRVKFKHVFAFFLILVTFSSCTNIRITEKDIIGRWKTNDGGIIIFKENNIFKTIRLKGANFFEGFTEYEKGYFSESGVWEIKKIKGSHQIILDFNVSDSLKRGFYTELSISGQGLFENKPPWDLFVWIGDPDDMNRYKFVKQ